MVRVNINKKSVPMEVDTGASVTILNEKTHTYLGKPSLTSCNQKLRIYTGEQIQVLGKVLVGVNYKDQDAELPALVVRGDGPCLLCRDCLKQIKLDWHAIFQVQTHAAQINSKQILEKYPLLFNESLGTIKGFAAKICVPSNAKPQYYKPRQDHDRLLDSLSSWFGVGGVVLHWFKSYLSDRVQCIKIGSILSDAKKLLYGVPQGSVLGPILFSLYTTPLSKVIQNHPGISFQFYADDTQLYVHLTHKNVTSARDKLSHCLEDVKRWLSTHKLKLNPDKTEFIVFGSKFQREKLNHSFPVNILCNLISPTDAVRNLGVWFDSDFSFSCHVMKVCKACFAHVRDLKRLQGHLTYEAALMATNALVGSRLDYCNSLFRGLSALDLRKLQCVQNSLARIVANTTKYSHITPVRKARHWLPIKYHSIFKTAACI